MYNITLHTNSCINYYERISIYTCAFGILHMKNSSKEKMKKNQKKWTKSFSLTLCSLRIFSIELFKLLNYTVQRLQNSIKLRRNNCTIFVLLVTITPLFATWLLNGLTLHLFILFHIPTSSFTQVLNWIIQEEHKHWTLYEFMPNHLLLFLLLSFFSESIQFLLRFVLK